MHKLTDVTLTDGALVGYDQHVREYYAQPANDFEEYASSKFAGETLALAKAYELSLDGFSHDSFGESDNFGFFCRVLFSDCPWIVCFVEDSQGFVTEIYNREYEDAFASWVETLESEDVESFPE